MLHLGMVKTEMIDVVFGRLYDAFVLDGGLDQTTGIVSEDWERQHKLLYCVHSILRQKCPFCKTRIPTYVPGA